MAESAPLEHPEGFEVRRRSGHGRAPDDERPEWLVGADEVLQGDAASDRPPPPLSRPGPPAGAPAPPTQEGRAWRAAASSVPKLKLAPPRATQPADQSKGADLDDPESPRPKLDPPSKDQDPAGPATRKLRLLEEPWWLVWTERLATDRRIWAGGLILLALGGGAAVWRASSDTSASLAAIKRHAQRFEGRSVTVRGKVGEVFEVGQGYVFQLHQGRDTVVVFSSTRRPTTHERLVVVGTVSTGYLDGVPRIALFESP